MSATHDSDRDYGRVYALREIARAVNTIWMASEVLRRHRILGTSAQEISFSKWDDLLLSIASRFGGDGCIDDEVRHSYWKQPDIVLDTEISAGFLLICRHKIQPTLDRKSVMSPAVLEPTAIAVIADGLSLLFEWLTECVYHLAEDTGDPSHVEVVCQDLDAQVALVSALVPDVRSRLNLRTIVRDTCAKVVRESEFDHPRQSWWRAWRRAVLDTLPAR